MTILKSHKNKKHKIIFMNEILKFKAITVLTQVNQ